MNPDYDKILQDRQIDKFISNNKFDPEVIHDFINFITSKDINDYFLYKDTLISLIDTKNYTEIPRIFYSMLKCINDNSTINRNIFDHSTFDHILEDLVGVCSNFSVNIIQKYKGSPFLLDILNLLVDISNTVAAKKKAYPLNHIH